MALTQLADLGNHEVTQLAGYSINQFPRRSRLSQLGVFRRDPVYDAVAGSLSKTVQFQNWNFPANVRSTPGSDDPTQKIVPYKATTGETTVARHVRNIAFAEADIVAEFAGQSFLDSIVNYDATVWANEIEYMAITGAMAMLDAAGAAFTYNASVTTGTIQPSNRISNDNLLNTIHKVGEGFRAYTKVVMHSRVYRTLQGLNLITSIPGSEGNANVGRYLGQFDVSFSDQLPVVETVPNFPVSPILIMPAAGIGLGISPLVKGRPLEYVRDGLAGNGSGVETVVSRRKFAVGMRGVNFVGTIAGGTPTDAEWTDEDSFELADGVTDIGILRLWVNV